MPQLQLVWLATSYNPGSCSSEWSQSFRTPLNLSRPSSNGFWINPFNTYQ